ncbi:MAG: hypothetical protein A2Z14_07880 [Chloroflexi bacterium RBG_16_48_8]|nr:MAG: hypothetical protein A2Z14_07880 [Chloroflexi bacterium RBG_16_48_8]
MYPTQTSLVPVEGPLVATDPLLLEKLLQPCLMLFWGTHTPTPTLLMALTALAAQGHPLRVFDGGNRFNGYFVARMARRFMGSAVKEPIDPHAILNRIRLSRAFTCFQMADLIENTPVSPEPLFILDLLNTFYDESVPLRDTKRLLSITIAHLKRLASTGPVIVGTREPRALVKERWTLLDQLQLAADNAWLLRAPQSTEPVQPRLF